jgi:hypothetical protein
VNDVVSVAVSVTAFAVVVFVLVVAYSIVRRPPIRAALKISRWFDIVVAWQSDDSADRVEPANEDAGSTNASHRQRGLR